LFECRGSEPGKVTEPVVSRSESAPRVGRVRGAGRWARALGAVLAGRWALYGVYLGEAWVITGVYWKVTHQLGTATIEMFAQGTASKPFAYRVLMPWVLGWVNRLNGVDDLMLTDIGLRVLVLFGLMVVMRRWLRHFVDPVLADVGPLLLGGMLPGTFVWYWPYDFAGILVWTVCLLALVERRYALYLAVFTIGMLNRETTVFLLGVFALTQWETLGARRTLRWAGAQLAISAGIYVGLRLAIHPVGGEMVEMHLLKNAALLTGRARALPFEGWTMMLSALGFLWLLAPWYWGRKSVFLRRACWIVPVHAAAIVVTGRLVEPRLWNEWIPVVLAMAGQTLMEFRREDGRQREAAPAGG
jgi:hypothetical protein